MLHERLYLLARVLRDFSKLYRARGKLAMSGTRAVPIRHFGWRLAAKAWFYEAPATSVSVVSLLMMVVLAYCLVVVEAPHADEPRSGARARRRRMAADRGDDDARLRRPRAPLDRRPGRSKKTAVAQAA